MCLFWTQSLSVWEWTQRNTKHSKYYRQAAHCCHQHTLFCWVRRDHSVHSTWLCDVILFLFFFFRCCLYLYTSDGLETFFVLPLKVKNWILRHHITFYLTAGRNWWPRLHQSWFSQRWLLYHNYDYLAQCLLGICWKTLITCKCSPFLIWYRNYFMKQFRKYILVNFNEVWNVQLPHQAYFGYVVQVFHCGAKKERKQIWIYSVTLTSISVGKNHKTAEVFNSIYLQAL